VPDEARANSARQIRSGARDVRILYVIPWLADRYGGPPVLALQAAAALGSRGHAVEIMTTNVDGGGRLDVPTDRAISWRGATVRFHHVSRPRAFLTSWSILRDLRHHVPSFDLVHIHYLYRFHSIVASSVAKAHRVPYVVQAHGSLNPWHRSKKRRAKDVYHALIEDRVIDGAAAVLCTSVQEEAHIRSLGYATPTAVVPAGLDPAALREPGETDWLESYGVDRNEPVITFLGRISTKKGVPLLVEAFRSLADFPNSHLVIAGPDEDGIATDLRRQLSADGAGRRISFVGPVAGARKRGLLQLSSAFVLPSADESFGIAVAEAMAVGCPVVVTADVAIAEAVEPTRAGLIVEREPEAIADAIRSILSNPHGARAMGAAGRRIIEDRYSWPAVAELLERTYETARDRRVGLAVGTGT
jgi:glycosyltransferase involved in cell wall biosynthesis